MADSADYVVVGGGLAGLVFAHRLSKKRPDASVLVIEAGGDPRSNPDLLSLAGLSNSRGPGRKEDWSYETVPNGSLNDRMILGEAGKALGGSGNVNAGIWLRGNAADYNIWAKLAGDDTWSYEAMLPYLKMVENVQDDVENKEQHGSDGYIKVTQVHPKSPRKGAPLRQPLIDAFAEAGVDYRGDPNAGDQDGLRNISDAWDQGKRQVLLDVFDLSKVRLMTDIYVHRIELESRDGELVASRVDLGNGRYVIAHKEIILSAGAYQSPKIMMLSGVGDEHTLKAHNISTKLHNPSVGANLSDHLGMCIQWKVKHPEQGVALGSPLFNDPTYFWGYPGDLTYHSRVKESQELSRLIKNERDREIIMRPGGSHIEIFPVYFPLGPEATAMGLIPNGEYISTCSLCVSPASRGYVKLKSSNPEDPPVIDRNFNHEDADLYMHREAMRFLAKVLLGTKAGRSFIEKEMAPEGSPLITEGASDAELNERIKSGTFSISHPMGTCAMGAVVDSRCRVKGVKGLRIIDASILPVPHGAPLQPLIYALAEKMAHLVATGE